MAIENIQKVVTLDVYDHDSTTSTVKTIAFDNDTRYVAAEIRNEGQRLDIGPDSDVRLTIIRPDKVGVSISGEPYQFEYSHSDGNIDPETGQEIIVTDTYYGAYAELTQAAISVAGVIYAQFKITSGSQILRTEIFLISNGRALDVEPDSWAGEYDRYDVIGTELLERMEAAEAKANKASSDIRGYASRIATAEAKLNDIADINAEDSSLIITTSTPSSQKRLTPSYITDSASGAVAHFVDGADNIPMKSVKVNIAPVQSGSGDPSPSNVRAISGWSSVKVTRAGKNLLEPWITSQVKNGVTYTASSDGTIVTSGQATANSQILSGRFLLPVGDYVLSGCPSGGSGETYFLRALLYRDNTLVRILNSDYGTGATFTISESDADCEIIVFSAIQNGNTVNATWKPMIEVGTSATAYEPYNGNTYTISLSSAGTVYGGTLDAVSGVLTVDRAFKVFNGTERWEFSSASIRPNINIADMAYKGAVICNMYTYSASSTAIEGTITTNGGIGYNIWIKDSINGNSLANWKAYLAEHQLQVVYMLATPITYNLTPTEVKSLLGINNIWSDAGDVEVEYRADTKLYIDKKLGG